MTRRGYALLPILWMIVLLSSVVLIDSHEAELAIRATRNRILGRQAWWARQACVSALQSRMREHVASPNGRVPTGLALEQQLEGGSSCGTSVRDNGTVLNVNTADSAFLSCLLGDTSAVAVLRFRPLPSVSAIPLVTGGGVPGIAAALDIRGPNRFNVNTAPLALLGCVPEVEPQLVAALASFRLRGAQVATLAELAAVLDPAARRRFVAMTATRQTALLAAAPSWDVTVSGRAGTPPVTSEMILRVAVRGDNVDLLAVEVP